MGGRHAEQRGPRRGLFTPVMPNSRIGRRLALIALVDSLGSGMFYTGSALYFTRIVGLEAGQVGAGLAAGGLAGLLCAVPVGMLSDRVGAGRVLIGLQVWRALCYATYCFTTGFGQFVVLAACIGVTDAATPPNHQAVVSAMVPSSERVETLAKVRAVRNLGFGLGALITTGVIAEDSRTAYLTLIAVNALSFLFTALMLWANGVARTPRAVNASDISGGARPSNQGFNLRVEPRYAIAAVLNGTLAVHMTLLAVGLPLWIAEHTRVPIVMLGPLIVANTVLAVLLQARFARPATQVQGAARCSVWAGMGLAAFAVTLYLTGQVSGIVTAVVLAVVAVVLLTAAELWQSAAGWTISYELAPESRRTQYLSTFHLGISIQAIAAPWLITEVVFSAPAGWLVFAAVLAGTGLAVPLVTRWVPKPRFRGVDLQCR